MKYGPEAAQVTSMFTLHLGTVRGLAVKILWFLPGLSLAVLSVTGLIMYWNRYLPHHLPPRTRPKPAVPAAR
jgi:uncharacterized iron-regulated membrane protein